VAVRLAAIYAHPDDDTYSLGGVLAKEGIERIQYTVVVATSGEAGIISDPALASRENLAAVREGEEREALAALGFAESSVHFLRYPDGGLKDVPHQELVGKLADVLRETRPHLVVTFGPEGITKHDDHITVSQAATEAFHDARAEAADDGQAFQLLYYNALPKSGIEGYWQELRSRGVDIGDPEGPFMPRGVPDETIAVRVDCMDVVKRKLDAIRAHRTQQVELEYLPQDLQPEVLGEECFVQAWPPPDASIHGPPKPSLLQDVHA
jgi:LmbE family N-acetylglucosaminyl deacetylase